MAKSLRKLKIFCIAGENISVSQNLVHAAMLGVEHVLKLRIRQILRADLRPIAQFDEHDQRGLIIGVKINIAQPSHDFVHRVPGHADKIPPGGDVVPLSRAIWKCTNQSTRSGVLAFLQFSDDVIATLLELPVTRRGKHHHAQERMNNAPVYARDSEYWPMSEPIPTRRKLAPWLPGRR